jgi:hypothetical protein
MTDAILLSTVTFQVIKNTNNLDLLLLINPNTKVYMCFKACARRLCFINRFRKLFCCFLRKLSLQNLFSFENRQGENCSNQSSIFQNNLSSNDMKGFFNVVKSADEFPEQICFTRIKNYAVRNGLKHLLIISKR